MAQNNFTDQDTELCCVSLSLIGADPISGLGEETDVAATCARLYPVLRNALLSRHPWGFVNQKRQLARAADITPVNQWKYAYKLPADMLAGPTTLFGDGVQSTDYEVSGGYIHCSYDVVIIRYRGGVDPSIWPPYFVQLFTVAFAADLAKPVVDNTALSDSLRLQAFGLPEERGLGGLFADARRLDAQNKPIQTLLATGDPLTATRF